MGHTGQAKNWIHEWAYKEEFQDMQCEKGMCLSYVQSEAWSQITKLLFVPCSTFTACLDYFITTSHDISVSGRGIQQLLPGSFSFLQQELQWCFALKFFIASSPRLAGPNTISYDLRNRVHMNITCTCSLASENFIILEVFLYPYLFSPAFITEGSVKFSPTPSDSTWRKS